MGIYPSSLEPLQDGWIADGGEMAAPVVTPGRRGRDNRISDAEIDEHLQRSLRPVLLSRARIAVGFLATSCVVFFATRVLSGSPIEWTAQAVRVANFLALLPMLVALRGAAAARRSETVVLLASAVSLGCAAAVCTIERDTINTALSVAILAVSASAFLPWSLRHQLVLALTGTAAILANQFALGLYHQTVTSITLSTAILAILATVVVTGTLEQARRRGAIDELRRRRAEDSLRGANEALEQRVLERTTDLRETMQELRAFNYSVSHDLRAPLRHIDGMSRLLEDEYASDLDGDARTYLNRLQGAAGRMGQLIDALLARSRVGQAEMNRERIDLCPLAETIVEDLRSTDPGRIVDWVPPSSLMVEADRTLAAVVLQHLIGNAWKFTRDRQRGRIELGELCIGGRREVYVRDNGVGFPMEHAGKLFENFQRLHGEEFEGTGIGLATVARIAARHGGGVRIQSTPGRGTTVFFSLGDDPDSGSTDES